MSLDVSLLDPTSTYETGELYHGNITHNLGEMASKAKIYDVLWHPVESNKPVAVDIIKILEDGLKDLKSRPKYFRQFDAENGWGRYDDFVPFVEEYLNACKEYPLAKIDADR